MIRHPAARPPASWRLGQVALFLLLVSVYLLIYAGRFHVIDEVSVYSMAESLAKRRTLDTDQIVWTQWVRAPREVQGDFGPDGTLYSKRGFGTAFAPALLIRAALTRSEWGLVDTAFFTNGFVTALAAVVLAALARRLGYSPMTALLLGGIYGLATLALPYARMLFGEPVSALALLSTAYALVRSADENVERRAVSWAVAAGLWLSLALWVRLFTALALLPFALFLIMRTLRRFPGALRSFRPPGVDFKPWVPLLAFVAVTVLVGLGGNLWYNAYRFGSPLASGYQFAQGESFTTPLWIGLYGLLLSPFRGLFWFSPVLLAALPGTVITWRRDRAATLLIWGLALAYLLPFSMWWMWWGGFAWGPRFLLPVVPFLLLLVAPLLEMRRGRAGVLALAAVSLAVQLLAVAADFTLTETVIEKAFPQPAQSAAMVEPRWSPIVLQAKHLSEGFWDIAWVSLKAAAWPVLAGGCASAAAALFALLVASRRPRLAASAVGLCVIVVAASYLAGLSLLSERARAEGTESQIAAAADAIKSQLRAGDTVVSLAPYDYPAVLNQLRAPVHHVGLAPHPAPLQPQEEQQLARAIEGRVWLLAPRVRPADQGNYAEQWLSERGFTLSQQWHGETRVAAFAPMGMPAEERALAATFADGIILESVILYDQPASAGGVLRVETRWRAGTSLPADYTLFLHLLSPDGRAVAGQDGPPANGYRATSGWQPGERVADRRALDVPLDAAGVYALEIGLYDAATGDRLPVRLDGAGGAAAEDRVLVGDMRIAPSLR